MHIYVGKDRLHGLIHGNRYHVNKMNGKDGRIWADIYLTSGRVDVGGMGRKAYGRPFIVKTYDSEALFEQNWVNENARV